MKNIYFVGILYWVHNYFRLLAENTDPGGGYSGMYYTY